VLDGVKALDRIADDFRGNSRETGGTDGGEYVLNVMLAFQGDGANLQNELGRGLLGSAEVDRAVVNEGSLANDARMAEPEDARLSAGRSTRGGIVVGIQDECIAGTLIREDALLGSDIIFQVAVTIEVVRRNVEDRSDIRAELIRSLQLEAGNFEYRPAIFAGFINQGDNGDANVASNLDLEMGGGEDFSTEAGGGGLAVRAGNRNGLADEEARSQFQFSDHGQAKIVHLDELGGIERNAGADDDQVLAPEGEQAVTSRLHHDALVQQRGKIVSERGGAAHVGDSNQRTLAPEEERSGETGFAESDDQYLFAFEFHAHIYPMRDSFYYAYWSYISPCIVLHRVILLHCRSMSSPKRITLVWRMNTPRGPRRYPAQIVQRKSDRAAVAVPPLELGLHLKGQWQLRYWNAGHYSYEPVEHRQPAEPSVPNSIEWLLVSFAIGRLKRRLAGEPQPLSLREQARAWKLDLLERGHREAAKQGDYMLKDFLPLTLAGSKSVLQVTRQNVLAYHKALRDRLLSERTIKNRHVNLKAFLKFSKITVVDMPPAPRYEKKDAQVCTDEQMQTLLDWCRVNDPYVHVLVELGRQTGLRKRELMHASWDQVRWSEGAFKLVENAALGFTIKTRVQRTFGLDDDLLALLRDWQSSRPNTTLILGTRTDKPNQSLLKRLKSAVVAAELPPQEFSLHMMRRYFLTTMLQGGVDVKTVQDMVGHTSISTTQLYAKAKQVDAQRVLLKKVFGRHAPS